MVDFFLPLLLITPFVVASAIAYYYSHSAISPIIVILGAIAGAVLIGLSGILWIQTLHRRWMESQAAGFIFLPVTLPICAYTGAVSGASIAAILSGYSTSDLPSPLFQIVAIGFTIWLGGLIPSAIVTLSLSNPMHPTNPTSQLGIGVMAISCAGVVSAWSASQLAHWLIVH